MRTSRSTSGAVTRTMWSFWAFQRRRIEVNQLFGFLLQLYCRLIQARRSWPHHCHAKLTLKRSLSYNTAQTTFVLENSMWNSLPEWSCSFCFQHLHLWAAWSSGRYKIQIGGFAAAVMLLSDWNQAHFNQFFFVTLKKEGAPYCLLLITSKCVTFWAHDSQILRSLATCFPGVYPR